MDQRLYTPLYSAANLLNLAVEATEESSSSEEDLMPTENSETSLDKPGQSFNAEYQSLVSSKELPKLKRLRQLVNDFVSVSQDFAQVIISEQFLPNDQKTIQPAEGSGHGGSKYLHKGILFKFCVDVQKIGTKWIFGGSHENLEMARKSGAHELLGASALFDCQGSRGLHFPLVATVDYLGWIQDTTQLNWI